MQTPQSHRPRPWHKAPPGGCPGARHRRSDSARASLHAAPGPLLRDGEKLGGAADSPANSREDASSKKFLKPAGRMLSPALGRRRRLCGTGLAEAAGRRGAPGRWPGKRTQTPRRAGPGSPRAASASMSCLRGPGQRHRSGQGAGTKPLKWSV